MVNELWGSISTSISYRGAS